MPVDPSQLDKTIAKIKETYGDVVHRGSERPKLSRIPFDSLELNYATGGGIPIGRFSHLYGGFSSGKSLTCWNVIKNAQQLGLTCVYYDIEKQFEESFVKRTGVDIDALQIVDGTTIEETGVKLEALMGAAHVHVLDSLSSAVSIDELNAKAEEWRPGIAARAWGKILRRALERFDPNDNAVIMVNQVRDVFGSGGEEPPGGRFIEHTSSLSLYFRRSSWLGRDADGYLSDDNAMGEGISGASEPEGIEYLIRVNKSRVCRPLRTARLRLDFASMEYDRINEIYKAAKYFGVLDIGKGGWCTLPDGSKIQGNKKIRQYIEGQPELQKLVEEKVMERA